MIKKAQDVLNDSSHATLYKIAKSMDFKLPKYVEEGVPLSKEASDKTIDALFADTVNRRYPITDRANTWLSAAYFAKTASDAYSTSDFARVADRLLKAAELYGISGDVEAVMAKINDEAIKEASDEFEKEAEAAESCYGDPATGGYPMFDGEQVKRACAYFAENAYAYDWRRRADIARNIMRKAAEYGIRPSETVRKEAGAGFPRIDFLAENLMAREAELERRGLGKMAGDMRRAIKVICVSSPEEILRQLEPLREMVSGADEMSGIDRDYGTRFMPPADFLFDVGDDEARDFRDDAVPVLNEVLSAKALSSLPKALFARAMSPSTLSGILDDDGVSVSPRKVSITIVKMAPRDQGHLLDVIRDFTENGNALPCDDCGVDDTEDVEDLEDVDDSDYSDDSDDSDDSNDNKDKEEDK